MFMLNSPLLLHLKEWLCYNALNPVPTGNPFFCTAECNTRTTHNFESSALPTSPGPLRLPRS